MARMSKPGISANVEMTVAELEKKVGKDAVIRVSRKSLEEAVTKLAKERLERGLT